MKLLITAWAALHYNPVPPIYTLRRWARDGEIWPPPEKAGKHWYVDENATRMTSTPAGGGQTLLERLQSA